MMATVALATLSRCFFSKHWAYNAVVCDRSSSSHGGVAMFRFLGKSLIIYSIKNNEIKKVPT